MATVDVVAPALRTPPSYNPLTGGQLGSFVQTFRTHGINGALRDVMIAATQAAKRLEPNSHLIKLEVPIVQFLKLVFPGGRFANPKAVYVAFSETAVRHVMKEAEAYEKGKLVKTMSELLGSGPNADDLITAGMAEWNHLQPVVKSFLGGETIGRQAEYIEQNLQERFGAETGRTLEISTSSIKQLMFSLIGRLIVPGYRPRIDEVAAHVEEFEALIAGTSKVLFDTIFSSPEFTTNALQAKEAEDMKERYRRFYDYLLPLQHDDDNGMMTALLHHSYYDREKTQATVMGMFEAGSKTLTQAVIETFYACASDPQLWSTLKGDMSNKALSAAFFEAARRNPPVDLTFREVQNDGGVLGYNVEKGAIIILNVKDALTDAAYWPEPQKFVLNRPDPEHRRYLPWLDSRQYARGCVGMPYSFSVGITTLGFFLSRYDRVVLVEDGGMRYDATVQRKVKLRFERSV